MNCKNLHDFLRGLPKEDRIFIRKQYASATRNKAAEQFIIFSVLIDEPVKQSKEQLTQKLIAAGVPKANIDSYCGRILDRALSFLVPNLNGKEPHAEDRIQRANYLSAMMLYQLTERELKAARKQLKERPNPEQEWRVILEQGRLLFRLRDGNNQVRKTLEKKLNEARQAVSNTPNADHQIYELYLTMVEYTMRRVNASERKKKVKEAINLNDQEIPQHLSRLQQLQYAALRMQIATWDQDFLARYYWTEKAWQLTKQERAQSDRIANAYFVAFDDHMSSVLICERYEEVEALLKEMSISPKYFLNQIVAANHTKIYTYLTILATTTWPFTPQQKLSLEDLKESYDEYYDDFSASRWVVLTYLFGTVFFIRGEYSDAEYYFDRIKTHKAAHVRSDLQRSILLAKVVQQIEEFTPGMRFNYIQSLVDQVRKRLTAWGITQHDRIIIEHLYKIAQLPIAKAERMPIWKNLYDELYILRYSAPNYKHKDQSFALLLSWLTYKLDINDPAARPRIPSYLFDKSP